MRDCTGWAPTPLEQAERLEQLRALEHDRHIQVAVSSHQIPPGVDKEADLERVRQIFGDVRV
jgi:CMP-2-keto-3-deoxyoctulosonic acid synthetase